MEALKSDVAAFRDLAQRCGPTPEVLTRAGELKQRLSELTESERAEVGSLLVVTRRPTGA